MNKILVIVASNNKNSETKEFASEVVENIKVLDSDFICEIVHLADYNIYECIGCKNCFINGFCKITKDDVNIIINKIYFYDIIIWACPSYLDNVPGCFKKLLDRIAHFSHTMNFAGKLGFVIITTSNSGSEEIKRYLFKIFPYMGFKMLDCYTFIKHKCENEKKYCYNVAISIINRIKMNYGLSNIILENIFNNYKMRFFKKGKVNEYGFYEINYWNQNFIRQSKSFQEFSHVIKNYI